MHASTDRQNITRILSTALNRSISITRIEVVGGGSISDTYKLLTSAGKFFLKRSTERDANLMFEKEVLGLDLLRIKSRFTIPKVIAKSYEEEKGYLLLEYIESAVPGTKYWQEFGKKLAGLHKNTDAQFGLKDNNFIGSLQQLNKREDHWSIFFINNRIVPMLELASARCLASTRFILSFTKALDEIASIMPVEPPALLHGDLWSGNFIPTLDGQPCLIDPAVYYGHREMELAFTYLFGGFGQAFYDSYNEVFPLQKEFDERVDLYNLYPLLVHLNLFGISYLPQIERIIKRFK